MTINPKKLRFGLNTKNYVTFEEEKFVKLVDRVV